MAHEPEFNTSQYPALSYTDLALLMFEHASIAIAIGTLEGQLHQVNPAFCALLGYDAAMLVGRPYTKILHPDSHPLWLAALQQITKTCTPASLELQFLSSTGEIMDTMVQLGVGMATTQPTPLLLTYVTSIPTHSDSPTALERSHRLYKSLVHSIEGIVWEADAQTCEYTFISPKVEGILGYSPGEWLSTPQFWRDHVHPEDRDRVIAAIRTEVEAERDHECEYRIRAADGRWVWLHDVVNVIKANGEVRWVRGISIDITERKRVEESLQRQVEREHVMAEIARRIRQSLKLEAILTTTVSEVRQFLKSDRVVVYRFLPDWNGQVIVESARPGVMQILGCNIQDNCFQNHWRRPYMSGGVGVIEDLHTLAGKPKCYLDMLKTYQIRANLVVPILQGNVLWGLLIAHQCEEPRRWEPDDIEFLKQMAAQMAIAIQQSELYEQVQRLNATLERQVAQRTQQLQQAYIFEAMLKRITDRVRDSLNEDQILQNAVEEMGRVMNLHGCNAALYNIEEKISQIRYEYTTLPTPFQGYTMQMENFRQGYDQLLQGQYFQFCSLSSYPKRGFVAMLACPIMDDQGVLGDLWLINHTSYEFTEQDIRLTQQIANQCAIALRQARLYKQAQNQVEKLEQLNYLKDDFLSTVSHELRTPMANIKMATQMLEISLKRLGVFETKNEAVARYFRILKDEGQREINLINDLLDLSRLDAGTATLSLSQTSLNHFVAKIMQPFLERAHNHRQRFQVQISPELPTVKTDLAYLERILTELLNNACKYTPSGETITLSLRSLFSVSQPSIGLGISTISAVPILKSAEPDLEITVSNTGVEIPPVELSHLFDKFYRVPNNDPWKHGGTGLGLALVKRLVELLGGTIDVSNPSGQLVFVVQLPKLGEAAME